MNFHALINYVYDAGAQPVVAPTARASSICNRMIFRDMSHRYRRSTPAGLLGSFGEIEDPRTATGGATAHSPSDSDHTLTMRCDDLRSRLENLPQELYDEIRALTFAFDFTSEARCIDQHGYKPPMQLQINQNLRAQFLPRYYGSEEDWVFVSRSRFDNHFKDVEMWLNSLSPEALFAVHNRKRRALPGRCDAEGHYSIVGESWTGGIMWRDICWTRSRLLLYNHESSCWAWSPGVSEYGRRVTRFWRCS